MRRAWTLLLFPSRIGALTIPELVFRTYDPTRAEALTLRCGASRAVVSALPASTPPSTTAPPSEREANPTKRWPQILVALAALLAIALMVRLRRRSVPRDQLNRILQHFDHPRTMRTELYEVMAERGLDADALLRESSERGDAFRSVQSLIDIAEKETLTGNVSKAEVRRRLVEFFRAL